MAKKGKVVEDVKVCQWVLSEAEREALRGVAQVYGDNLDGLRGPIQLSLAETTQLVESGDVAHLTEAKQQRVRDLCARWLELGDRGPAKARESHPSWLLIQLRSLAGVSASEAARKSEMSEVTYSAIERAKSLPNCVSLVQLYTYFRSLDGFGWLHMEHLLLGTCAELRKLHRAHAKAQAA